MKNVEGYTRLNGSRKKSGEAKVRIPLCSVLGDVEPGTCIQYNVFDQLDGAQERKMEREIADCTLMEVKWQV